MPPFHLAVGAQDFLSSFPPLHFAALLLAVLAWKHRLPWHNVLVLLVGTTILTWGTVRLAHLTALPLLLPSSQTEPSLLEILFSITPWLLLSRLLASQLWAWREGHPKFGLELLLLTILLAVLTPFFLFHSPQGWTPVLVSTAFILIWQILLTPWFLRKHPLPPTPDVLAPIAWLIFWADACRENSRALWIVLPPAFVAIALWFYSRKAKSKPDRA